MADEPTAEIVQWNPIDAIILPIFRRPIPAVFAAIVISVGAAAFSLTQADEYVSTADIAFPKQSIDTQAKGYVDSSELQVERRILTDERTLDITVEKLGADFVLEAFDPTVFDDDKTSWLRGRIREWQREFFAWRAEDTTIPEGLPEAARMQREKELLLASRKLLAENLEAELDYTSPVVELRFTSHTPERAREILGAILEAYKELRTEKFPTQVEDRRLLAEEQADEARRQRDRLTQFKQANEISDFDAQLERVSGRIDEIKDELSALGSDRTTQSGYVGQLETYRDAVKKEKTEFESVPNPKFVDKNNEIRELTEDLRQAIDNLAPGNPRIPELRRRLGEATAARDALEPTIRSDERTIPNPAWADLNLRVLDAKQELSKIEQRITRLRGVQYELEQRKSRLIELAPTYLELVQTTEAEESLAQRLKENVRVSEIRRTIGDDFQVYSGPTFPFEKTGPKRFKTLVAGGLFGIFVAFGLAILLDLLSSQVRSVPELQRAIGAPVIAVVGVATGVRKARWAAQSRPLGTVPDYPAPDYPATDDPAGTAPPGEPRDNVTPGIAVAPESTVPPESAGDRDDDDSTVISFPRRGDSGVAP